MGLLSPWLVSNDSVSLQGARVELRTPSTKDYAQWRDVRLASRFFLEPWEPRWDEADYTRSAFRDRLRQYQSLTDQDQAYSFFIYVKDGDHFCGAVTLSNVRRGIAQMATLGYWIGVDFAGQGLMTDAVMTLLAHAFSDLALHRVEAACLPHNSASVGLLRKCSFTEEGFAASYLKIAGRWEDHLLFAKMSGRAA
jgi:[ribosomal protein S5]-alanine N-acetyltransferase